MNERRVMKREGEERGRAKGSQGQEKKEREGEERDGERKAEEMRRVGRGRKKAKDWRGEEG